MLPVTATVVVLARPWNGDDGAEVAPATQVIAIAAGDGEPVQPSCTPVVRCR
jgi:hypothetical protein